MATVCFFFFQAEDGIRDLTVTGVQTCALPICTRMMLYVLRHGVAEEVGPEGTDGSRRLTPGGRRKLRAAAAGVRGLGVAFDAILTSPLVRAGETAAIVAEALGNQPAPRELAALEP